MREALEALVLIAMMGAIYFGFHIYAQWLFGE